jgi:hypothetical protein
MWVILDGCPPEYRELFSNYFDSFASLELIDVPKIGNLPTFALQLKLLTEQCHSETVYFAEDDYFYLPNTFHLMIRFLQENRNVDFVTPYDHSDYYALRLHKGKCEITAAHGKHWRTVGSTCLTFLTSKQTLLDTQAIFRTYCAGNFDASIWFALTKHRVFNVLHLILGSLDSKLALKILLKTWYFGWRTIVFGRRRRLWAPLPTIATAVEIGGLAPCFTWEEIFDKRLDP